jgi:hypothetical protein
MRPQPLFLALGIPTMVLALCLACIPLPGAAGDKTKTADPKTETGNGGKAPAPFTAPAGLLESLPSVKAVKAKPGPAAPSNGYLYYENMAVNYAGGVTLTDSVGSTQVSVYAGHIRWRFAVNSVDIFVPTGQGGPAGNGWQYPNANRFGIVLYQGGNYWNVTSTDPNHPTIITGISNTTPVAVAVNDTSGNYGDNWGAFDFYLRRDN